MGIGTDATRVGRRLAEEILTLGEGGPSQQQVMEQCGLDKEHLNLQVTVLAAFAVDFAISTSLGQDEDSIGKLTLEAFYAELSRDDRWECLRQEMERRFEQYQAAVNEPHPELGTGYSVARVFSAACADTGDAMLLLFAGNYWRELAEHVTESISPLVSVKSPYGKSTDDDNDLASVSDDAATSAAQPAGIPKMQVVAELLRAGQSPRQAVQTLQMDGLSDTAAVKVVDTVLAARDKVAKKNMLYGALWCGGGLIMTAFSYSLAEPGGRFVIATGAVVIGLIQFIRGLVGFAR